MAQTAMVKPLFRLRNPQRNYGRVDLALCAGLIVVVGTLVLLPLGYLLYGALRDSPPRTPGAGYTLSNILEIYGSLHFAEPFLTTLAIGISVGIGSAIIGILLAWIVARLDIPRPALWEKLLILPIYFSPLMLALAFTALGAPRVGFLNLIWKALGGGGSAVSVYSFAGIVFVLCVHYAPYAMLVLAAPMRSISAELEEAAQVLGSTRWHLMRTVTIPMLRPAIFSVVLIVGTLAAENFAVPTLLGRQSKISTIPGEIYYWLTYEPGNPNLAAAAGTLLLLVTISGIFVYRYMTRMSTRFVTVTGKPRSIPRLPLGKWRPAITGFLVLYLAITTVLPIASLIFGSLMPYIGQHIDFSKLSLSNYQAALRGDNLSAIANSLFLSVVSATLITLLGFLVSYVIRRTKVPGRGALDYLSALPIAIPGMVLGVGMVWAYVIAPFGLWGSIWLLLIAYMARFIVHAVRAINSSLLQVSGEMDEAAQVLGAGIFRRLRQITVPLTMRALLSSWVLVAIFVLNELSATILLYSSKSITLSVLTWNALDMYGAMQAFAFSVIQGFMTAILVWISYKLSGKTTW